MKRRTSADLGSPELSRAIGDALREMRAKHGHSQESLARHVPCDRSQITRVEMGRHNPSYAWLERLVKAMDENMPRFARLVEKYRAKSASVRFLRSLWFVAALRVTELMTVHTTVRRLAVHIIHLL